MNRPGILYYFSFEKSRWWTLAAAARWCKDDVKGWTEPYKTRTSPRMLTSTKSISFVMGKHGPSDLSVGIIYSVGFGGYKTLSCSLLLATVNSNLTPTYAFSRDENQRP